MITEELGKFYVMISAFENKLALRFETELPGSLEVVGAEVSIDEETALKLKSAIKSIRAAQRSSSNGRRI